MAQIIKETTTQEDYITIVEDIEILENNRNNQEVDSKITIEEIKTTGSNDHTDLKNQIEIKKEMKQETSEERENEKNLGVRNSGLRAWLNTIVLTVGFILSCTVVALLPSHNVMKNPEFWYEAPISMVHHKWLWLTCF